MKSTFGGIALGAMLVTALWTFLPNLHAQLQTVPCSVDGSKYPELIPEYFVWEFFFRSSVASALDTEDMSLKQASPDGFQLEAVRNSTSDLGISVQDARIFLEVGLKAVQRADALRAAVPSNALQSVFREHQVAAAEAVLDGRDDLARRLSPKSFQALRRRLPRAGTRFDFPPSN